MNEKGQEENETAPGHEGNQTPTQTPEEDQAGQASPIEEKTLALAHLELVDKSRVVMRLGKALLSCGAGAYRVKSAMARCAKAVGLDRLDSHVSLMEITTTAWQGQTFRTEVIETRTVGVNAAKLDKLMTLCVRLHRNMTPDEVSAELDRIDREDRHYPIWASVLASALACAAFSFLNNGRLVECSIVFVAAGLGQWLRRILLAKGVSHFVIWTLCAALSTLIYIGLAAASNEFGVINYLHEAGVMSSFLYLVPGFPLVTAILDFVRMDFLSAITRANYCLMVIASAGVSVWVISHLFAWPVEPQATPPISHTVLVILQIITSFVAAYGFAVLFNAPWKVSAVSGLIGALVNVGRLYLQSYGQPWQLTVGLAAFAAGLLATEVARHTHHSRVSLSVPAVVIMIPGVPFYRAMVALNNGDYFKAIGSVSEVFFVVMSIGFGLALARVASDKGWFFNAETASLKADLEATKKAANI